MLDNNARETVRLITTIIIIIIAIMQAKDLV
jgi:hypothetical protein